MTVAHIKIENGKTVIETLEEHTNAVLMYYNSFVKTPHIKRCLEAMIPKSERRIVLYLMEQAVKYHDEGKKSPIFQNKILNKSTGGKDSSHSYLSALIYIEEMRAYLHKVLGEERQCISFNEERMHAITELMANNIKGHHTCIDSIFHKKRYKDEAVFYKSLDDYETNIRSKLVELEGFVSDSFFVDVNLEVKELEKGYFYLAKLHFSLLINADFLATSDFFNAVVTTAEIANNIVESMFLTRDTIKNVITSYENTSFMQGIRLGTPNSEINKVRTEMFKEVERNYLITPHKDIYFLTAPTGGGKTNIGLDISLLIAQVQKKTKIVQVLPLNSVGEQTFRFIDELIKSSRVRPELINSSGIYREDQGEIRSAYWYDVYHLNRQMLGFPYIITSHVRLFDSLFSHNRISNLPLAHLCNSVIIIDEIQAYKEDRWFEIAYALNDLAKFYNITFVIMSATMIYLNEFLQKESYDLLENKEYYLTHPIFKDRFEVSDKYLSRVHSIKDVVAVVNEVNQDKKRVLIEVETKKKAKALYELIKENVVKENVILLTSDENSYARNIIIDALKKEENDEFVLKDVILVATSVIEYGVDIDFDIGIKQTTSLDAEEQFAGRINRSNKRTGVLYLVDLDDAFRNHLRSNYRYRLDHQFAIYKAADYMEPLRVLREKEIDSVYSQIIQQIVNERNTLLLDIYKNKDYRTLKECMQLIDPTDYEITFYIPYRNTTMDGYEVYKRYEELLLNHLLGYSEKRIRLLQIRKEMEPFLFKTTKVNAKLLGLKEQMDDDEAVFIYIEREDLLEEVQILDKSYKKLKMF